MAKQSINDPAVRHNSSGALIRALSALSGKAQGSALFIDLFCAALTTCATSSCPRS
ncbi:MAG: hypothetical protein ACLVJH_10190 [Faecalibacterium prausnitzii]